MEQRQVARVRYIQARASKHQSEIARARRESASLRSEMERTRVEFARLCRANHVQNKGRSGEEWRAHFSAMWRELVSNPKVQSASIDAERLVVRTHELTSTHGASGERHSIGEFTVVVALDGSDVCWRNETRRVDGVEPSMNAPRVRADGQPLVDQFVETLTAYIAQLELATVVKLAIQFIEMAPSGTAGDAVTRFPLATENN